MYRILLSFLALMIFSGVAYAQHGFEASWEAGMLGLEQNLASISTSPNRSEVVVGDLQLRAQGNLFETNKMGAFLPHALFAGVGSQPGNMPFMSQVTGNGFRDTGKDAPWNSRFESRIQGPGGYFTLKTNPDLVERGLTKRVLALWLERREQFAIEGVDAPLARAYANRFADAHAGYQQFADAQFSVKAREWDALGVGFAMALGRGKNLLHVAIGGKLLSASSFMQLDVYDSQFQFYPDGTVTLSSNKVEYAYNPSLQQAATPSGRRRYGTFENSWGVEATAGLVYQVLDFARLPTFEIGAGIDGLGLIQYWNLNHRRYTLPAGNYYLYSASTDPALQLGGTLDWLSNGNSTPLSDGITEGLPMRVHAHAKVRVGKSFNLQARASLMQPYSQAPWQSYFRATLSWEKKAIRTYLPVSYTVEQGVQVGLYFSIKDRLIIGSDDLMLNLPESMTRQGVQHNHLFLGLHFPLNNNQ